MSHRNLQNLGLLAAAALSTGCAAYKIDPPAGFAVVSENDWETRMKAQDNVGLRLRRFENVKGGTLQFWAADMVKKLGLRGYTLTSQSPVKSKNGKVGTRFDFDYETFDTEIPKFFTAVLFVTDTQKIVVQVAGDRGLAGTYRARIPEILGELKVRGCKAGSKICGGPQPPPLSTQTPPRPAGAKPDPGPAAAAVTPAAVTPAEPPKP